MYNRNDLAPKNCILIISDGITVFLFEKVEVDLALSAHANARRWYEMKKKQESKQEKTVSAHEKAFKAAERKTRIQLSQVALALAVQILIFVVVNRNTF